MTTDSTKVWPETNELAEMGEIEISSLWTMIKGVEHGREQKRVVYDTVLCRAISRALGRVMIL